MSKTGRLRRRATAKKRWAKVPQVKILGDLKSKRYSVSNGHKLKGGKRGK